MVHLRDFTKVSGFESRMTDYHTLTLDTNLISDFASIQVHVKVLEQFKVILSK